MWFTQAQVSIELQIGEHIGYGHEMDEKDLQGKLYRKQLHSSIFVINYRRNPSRRISMSAHETYDIEIAGLKRSLRLFEIKPGLKIAILNILGDTELVQACAKALNKKLKDVEVRRYRDGRSQVHPAGICPLGRVKKTLRHPAQNPTSPTWARR